MRSKRLKGILIKAMCLMIAAAAAGVFAAPEAVYAEAGAQGAASEAAEADMQGAASEAEASDGLGDEEPRVPRISVAVEGDGLTVSWTAPGAAGVAGATGDAGAAKDASSYQVYRSYKSGSGFKLLQKGIKGLSYRDREVASGKRAYYKVRAVMSDGTAVYYPEIASGIIYRVYIETGHGRDIKGVWDPGCTLSKYQEARLMIPICKAAAKYLRQKGVYVYTDAFDGNNRNLKWTLKKLKKKDYSVLLNVHCDSRNAPKGTMPLYRYSKQKKLARCLNKGVHQYVKIKDRGLKKRKDLDTLNKTKKYCTACLFETGSIKRDNKILRKKYDAYGKGLAKGVCDYLGIDW